MTTEDQDDGRDMTAGGGATSGGFEARGDEDQVEAVPASETDGGPKDLTAGAPVFEDELDQVHQRIPDTHQSGFG